MKTYVLIDDEYFFRKSIQNYLMQYADQYCMIGEANNGEIGMELIRNTHPDIALVDISMPIMDGLQMITQLKASNLSTKFILSTGYSDFEYAKQALSLGVEDYILKPVDYQELLACLQKISTAIDMESHQQSIVHAYYRSQPLLKQAFKKAFLDALISGQCSDTERSELQEQAEFPTCPYYLIAIISMKFPDPDIWVKEKDSSLCQSILENISSELCQSYASGFLMSPVNAEQLLVLFGLKDISNWNDQLEEYSRKLIGILKNKIHLPISIFAGTPYPSLNKLKSSYEEARSVQYHNFYENLTTFLYYDRYKPKSQKVFSTSLCQDLLLLLRQKDTDKILAYLKHSYDLCQQNQLPLKQVYQLTNLLITVLDDYITECRCEHVEYQSLQKALDCYESLDSIDLLNTTMIQVYADTIQQINSHSISSQTALIHDVQLYIIKNYSRFDLRLETIAEHHYVSSQYLCSLFKKEMHCNLTSYITRYRMQKAKEILLLASPSIQNTAELCGFADAGYFSKCFKKYYGISPKSFLGMQQTVQPNTLYSERDSELLPQLQ